MNKIIITTTIALCAQGGFAQTWEEWFQQNKTQKEYLLQQIAALKMYLEYLKEGYDVAKKGLDLVGQISDGKLALDKQYLESLRNVNAAISGSSKVTGIVAYQRLLMIEFRRTRRLSGNSALLSNDEKDYINNVYANMVASLESLLNDLDILIYNPEFSLTDSERSERLYALYEDAKDKYAFTREFCGATTLLIQQRKNEKDDTENYKLLIE